MLNKVSYVNGHAVDKEKTDRIRNTPEQIEKTKQSAKSAIKTDKPQTISQTVRLWPRTEKLIVNR